MYIVSKLKSRCIYCGREIHFASNFCPYCCKRLMSDRSKELSRHHNFFIKIQEEMKKKKNVNN